MTLLSSIKSLEKIHTLKSLETTSPKKPTKNNKRFYKKLKVDVYPSEEIVFEIIYLILLTKEY